MTRENARMLDKGERFPDMELQVLHGGTLRMPVDAEGSWTVILGYRGHW